MARLACDLSPVAVGLLREKEEYRSGRCLAFPSDIANGASGQPSPEHRAVEDVVPPSSADFVTLLFVLSAIDPAQHRQVIARLRGCLKVGGLALFRDYGRGDLAQLRFAPGHWLGGDLYVRGDGTLAAFFTTEKLREDRGRRVLRLSWGCCAANVCREALDPARTCTHAFSDKRMGPASYLHCAHPRIAQWAKCQPRTPGCSKVHAACQGSSDSCDAWRNHTLLQGYCR